MYFFRKKYLKSVIKAFGCERTSKKDKDVIISTYLSLNDEYWRDYDTFSKDKEI